MYLALIQKLNNLFPRILHQKNNPKI